MADEIDSREKLRALRAARSALEEVEREQKQVFDELARWRERYDQLVESLREGAVKLSFDADGKLTKVSRESEEALGLKPWQFVDRFEKEIVDEETLAELRRSVEQQLEGRGGSGVVEAVFSGDGGRAASFNVINVAVTDDDGKVVGVEAIARPAARPESAGEEPDAPDQFDQIMEDASRKLAAGGRENLDEVLAALGDFFDVDRASVSQYDDEGRVFESLHSWHRAGGGPKGSEATSIPISKLPWAYASLSAGEPVVIPAIDELPEDASAEKQLLGKADVTAALFVPMLLGESLQGYVSLQLGDRPREWSDKEVALAGRFATSLGSAMSREALVGELEEARREAEEAKSLTQKAEEAKSQAQKAEEAAETATADLEEAKNAADEAMAEIEELDKRAEEARAEAEKARSEAEEMRGDAETARAEAEEARKELEEVRSEAKDAQRRLEKAEAEVAELRDAAESAKAEIERERGRTEQFAADVEELQERLAGATPSDPDVTAEVRGPRFDPDATLELDIPDSAILAGPDEGGDEPESDADLPRALDLDEILERTQSAPDDEVDDFEAARQAAREAAGRDDDSPELKTGELIDAISSEVEEETADEDDSLQDLVDEDVERFGIETLDEEFEAETERDDEAEEEEEKELSEVPTGEFDLADLELDETDEPRPFEDEEKPDDEADLTLADRTPFDDAADVVFPDDMTGPSMTSDDSFDDEPIATGGGFGRRADASEMAVDEGVASALEMSGDAAEPLIPMLVGLEVELGLAEVGGNSELYRSLLGKFRNDYHSAAEKIGAAMERDNVEIAHLLVHAIKGVAGNIAANRVHDAAEELETALIDRDPANRQAALDTFSDALGEVIDSITRLESGEGVPVPSTEDSIEGHVSDPKVLRSYLEGLRQHLDAEKPKQCQLVMREIGARTWPRDLNDDVERLADLISGYRFDEARATFESLMEKLA